MVSAMNDLGRAIPLGNHAKKMIQIEAEEGQSPYEVRSEPFWGDTKHTQKTQSPSVISVPQW